jgi:TM2 domain-containing membrane protein YozV
MPPQAPPGFPRQPGAQAQDPYGQNQIPYAQTQKPLAQAPDPYGQNQIPFGPAQPGLGQPRQGYGQPMQGFPPTQPAHWQQGAVPPQGQRGFQPSGEVSPKQRNVVILLCFFLGNLGVHRFYLGKIITGILMIITVGGAFIWTLVDFLISAFGNYNDSKGRYVAKVYSKPLAIVLLILMIIIPVASIIILAPKIKPILARQFATGDEKTVMSVVQDLSSSENNFLQKHGQYSDNLEDLQKETDYVHNSDVTIENLKSYIDASQGKHCFSFIAKLNGMDSVGYDYDYCREEQLKKLSP